MGAVDHGQLVPPQVDAADKLSSPSAHRPLIEVKYVLLKAPQEPKDLPEIDLDPRDSPRWSFPPRDYPSVLLRDGYVSPNMYLCHGYGCFF